MTKTCPECGNNLLTSYRRSSFCSNDVKRYKEIPILLYVCKSCGFTVIPVSAINTVDRMVGELK